MKYDPDLRRKRRLSKFCYPCPYGCSTVRRKTEVAINRHIHRIHLRTENTVNAFSRSKCLKQRCLNTEEERKQQPLKPESKPSKDVCLTWEGKPFERLTTQTFYKALRCAFLGRSYSMGDFLYIRHKEDRDRMSFFEILLFWEFNGIKFVSCRVYYYPENTDRGRSPAHGEDEVLCMKGEVVMSCWQFLTHILYTEQEAKDLPPLKIVSFGQYCRCRAVRQRLGSQLPNYTSHTLFGAMGGISPKYRVLFSRSLVTDRTLAKLWRNRNTHSAIVPRNQEERKTQRVDRKVCDSSVSKDSRTAVVGGVKRPRSGSICPTSTAPGSSGESVTSAPDKRDSEPDRRDEGGDISDQPHFEVDVDVDSATQIIISSASSHSTNQEEESGSLEIFFSQLSDLFNVAQPTTAN